MGRPTLFLALSTLLAISTSVQAATVASSVEDKDSRPFLTTYPLRQEQQQQDDSSWLFSRALQALKFSGNDKREYELCEGDCDRDRTVPMDSSASSGESSFIWWYLDTDVFFAIN